MPTIITSGNSAVTNIVWDVQPFSYQTTSAGTIYPATITYCYPTVSAGNIITVNGLNYNWLNPPPTMRPEATPTEVHGISMEPLARPAPYTHYIPSAAESKAHRLLLSLLTDEQAAQYRSERAFEVRAPSGRRYRLKHGWASNIEVLNDEGRTIERLCVHPNQSVPYADNLLMQKLGIETSEEQLRRIANITPIRNPSVGARHAPDRVIA
ncbi:MAG: hypothetical protein NVS2B16_37430 [Chloroflexota bacterium]